MRCRPNGVIPLSSSFDHVGPIALTVADAALLWSVIANRPTPDLRAQPDLKTLAPRPIARVFRFTGGARRARSLRASPRSAAPGGRNDRGRRIAVEPAGILDAYVNVVLPEAASWHASLLDSRGADYTPMVRARLRERSIDSRHEIRRRRLSSAGGCAWTLTRLLTGHDAHRAADAADHRTAARVG